MLEGFKKKLKEEFPVIYKELDSPPYGSLDDGSSQRKYFKGDTPRLGKFLREREFTKTGDASLNFMGYFILATKVLVFITLVSLLITFILL